MSLVSGALTVALGFSISGAAASGFEAVTGRPAHFGLLRERSITAVAAVPVVTLGAAYILARALLFGPARPRSTPIAFVGTVVSGGWSLVIGAAALAAFM
ncbi:DUF6949 family protein [Hansschlegelia sp. KR7-227]|uniref:DUF6949 family protein n=1 Tax=Hansschlegelia sp. KR7-227 TaxID=3400914 RepID=UPI003C022B16